MKYEFSKHALEQMQARGISKGIVERIIEQPQQIRDEDGNKVYQSVVGNGRHLVRIFVNETKNPKLIITVYKTSKIKKYQ